MNYKQIHDSIIDRAKTRVLPKEVYTERHHIIPRCMNGSDDKSNLVDLTAKEHFIVHKLLVEIHPNVNGLWSAYYMMMTVKGKGQERNYHITSEEYNRVKTKRSQILSERFSGEGNPSKRPEVRLKQSLAGKNKVKSKEHRENLSKSKMGIGLGVKRPKHSKLMEGNKNPMFGTNAYEVNVKKFGKEIADNMIAETNKKKSENVKGNNNPMYGKSAVKVKIIDTETKQVFDSMKDAALYYGINASTLCNMLKGRFKNKTTLRYM